VLAVTAAVIAFRFHRGMIEVIVVMALLGMVTRMSF
jgi:chromate transporter